MNHVLVVDDEPAIVEIVRDYLTDAGYRVSTARSGEEALHQTRSIRPDLIVLDLGLPGLDGLDVTRTIRGTSAVPIIILTARSDETDRGGGRGLGAADDRGKPFGPRELRARGRAGLRRSGRPTEPGDERPLIAGELTVDPTRRRVTVAGRVVDLTATEFDLLARMAAAPGRVFTRGQLLETIHGLAVDAGERAIDAHVKNIRRKIEPDPHRPRMLVTVHGVGYRLADQ